MPELPEFRSRFLPRVDWVTCELCGLQVIVRKDGRLRMHKATTLNSMVKRSDGYCFMSGLRPESKDGKPRRFHGQR